ncbi:MAG: hypothetical protein COB07_04610 [Sulfurovum sp.]|nr:MAG: hypothetical protein COB07_04610 [Sulfurovum sp.]
MLIKITILLSLITIVFSAGLLYFLPSDYFIKSQKDYIDNPIRYPKLFKVIKNIRNILGYLLIVIGVIMLIFPGEGILTILVGLIVLNKIDLLLKLLSFRSVQKSLNFIRQKMGRSAFLYP